MKKRWMITMTAILALSLAGCGSKTNPSPAEDTDLTKITFVLDWTPNTNHTGLYVAAQKGYFKDVGLEVEIVQPPEGGAEVLVASGKAQFGVSFQDTMAPSLAGENALPIQAVAAILQHNTSGIISRKGEGMDVPKGLEGKRYATWESPIELASLKNLVEGDGGDFSKVELIPNTVTDEVSALKTNAVDAIWILWDRVLGQIEAASRQSWRILRPTILLFPILIRYLIITLRSLYPAHNF